MPDNRSTGELEDFVGSMIPSGDPVWPLSEAYIEGIPPADIASFSRARYRGPKSTLGWQQEKNPRRMGLAIRGQEIWTPTRANFNRICRLAADTIPVTTTSE